VHPLFDGQALGENRDLGRAPKFVEYLVEMLDGIQVFAPDQGALAGRNGPEPSNSPT
jgi:hypothetical protein